MKANPKVQQEIETVVSILMKKIHNRDPFYIAHYLGIEVTFSDFNENLYAFSERKDYYDRGRIYINKHLGSYVQKVLCSHELGHLLLHDVCEHSFFDSDIEPEKEYEANYFTAMLMPQIIINENVLDFPIEIFNEYITHRVMYASQLEKAVKLE